MTKFKEIWHSFRFKGATLLTVTFVVLMTFVVDHSVPNILRLRGQLDSINNETEGLRRSSRADSTFLENMKDDEFLEKYAREKFYMKRPGEEIYVIEIIEDYP